MSGVVAFLHRRSEVEEVRLVRQLRAWVVAQATPEKSAT